MFREIKSLCKTFLRFAYAIKNRNKFKADKDLIAYRLNICFGNDINVACESLSSENKRCTECGCFVRQKAKLSFESCPLKKW